MVPKLEECPNASIEAIEELVTYSLVARVAETPTFTIHRLVQDVTRRSQRWGSALEEALRWVNAAFSPIGNPTDVRIWPVLDPLAPHARTVVGFADSANISQPTARLMSNLGLYFVAKAFLAEAEPLLRRALAIDEEDFRPNHPKVAIRLINLSQLCQQSNRLKEAESCLQRAVAIVEDHYGPDHLKVVVAVNNLAQVFQDSGRLAEAEPLMRRTLAIDEREFGPDNLRVAVRLNNLAALLQELDRFLEAEPLIRRAMQILENNNHSGDPSYAAAINQLASILWAKGDLIEAEALLRQALAIVELNHSPNHPVVATALNNLSQLLSETNHLAEAEPLSRRALTVLLKFTKRNGYQHLQFEKVLANYRKLLSAMGMTQLEAESAIRSLVERWT